VPRTALSSSRSNSPSSALFERPKKRLRNNAFRWLIGLGLCLIGVIGWYFFEHRQNAHTDLNEKSIAVLPFESLSANKDETYFADGVQDEILANLARISELKVISRTPVIQYRPDAKRNLTEIANALGVANILEGTVRRAGYRIRLTVQLVDAATNRTIWSEIYDRDLSEIFAIQSEVALTVANKLIATFSPEEKNRIQEQPTNNLEAYDLYLRAKELMLNVNASHFGYSANPLSEVTRLLEEAVRLDWRFTLAYCTFAAANAQLYAGYNPSPARRATGDAAIKRALGLQPDLPEVHLAYAYHLGYAYHDYELPKMHLAIAKRGLPSNVEAFRLEGWISRRQGYWEKCIQQFNKAITLDPRNPIPFAELGDTFYNIRRFREAERAFNHAIDLAPDLKVIKLRKAVLVIFQETGDDTAAH
jgi:TolB-like protein